MLYKWHNPFQVVYIMVITQKLEEFAFLLLFIKVGYSEENKTVFFIRNEIILNTIVDQAWLLWTNMILVTTSFKHICF